LTYREDIRTWTAFVGDMRSALDEQRPKQGAGIRFLTETVTSPTLGAELRALLTAFPQAKWHQYEPANHDNARNGAVMAFGQPVNTTYRFDVAERILSLDADFLSPVTPGYLRYSREFIARRRVMENNPAMNRLYVIETTPSNTGAMADHTWTVKPSQMEGLARLLAAGSGQAAGNDQYGAQVRSADGIPLDVIMRDLQQHPGASIVIAGESQPPIIHALAHAMNNALGNVGKTVFYTDPLEVNSVDQRQSLQDLVNDLDAGRVELLVILGGNPVYNTPVDLKLDFERLKKAKLRVHLSEYKDETSELCHWHVPAAHYLESWGDARSYDGTVTIVQPLIEPLYEGKTAHELLAVFSDQYDRRPYDIVKGFWQQERSRLATAAPSASPSPTTTPGATPSPATTDFENWWRQSIHDGFIPNSAFQTKTVSFNGNFLNQTQAQPSQPASGGFELVFRLDPSIHDGRFANNGWLQELPKPLTKVTWDNVALVSPNNAQALTGGLKQGNAVKGRENYVPVVELFDQQGRALRVPVWVTPGQPDGVITVHLGYGRRLAGRVGGTNNQDPRVGFDAYTLRTSYEAWVKPGVQVRGTNDRHVLATTQLHFNLEDPDFSTDQRDIVRSETLADFLNGEKHDKGHSGHGDHPSIYPHDFDYNNQDVNAPNYKWGMAIDLNNCIGCNGCTIACQAENNIPVVGKTEVVRSREMHWIRVDTYFSGFDPNNPKGTNFMPVPCMHCEQAPCEPVCPVHATVHSAEGLNDMVYNRCVGTKYCSNNCPYKVRRFNFFLYQDWDTPTYQLMRNPDVSVRSRGVMEKCTYCVQRIQNGKIQAEMEDRKVRDGEIVTACQAVCPTEAIVFGDLNDPNSRVAKLQADKRNYSLLGELNTRPRTTYLSQLKNPNPEIEAK
jgi:molybdopterin-containing oxidoreductase family iron-sulfur binding subunit